MDPRIRQYLNKKELEAKQRQAQRSSGRKWEEYKRDVLLCAGLYDKEYSPIQTEEYCHSEYDSQSGTYLYYKQVPIQVTDQEFEEIRKYSAISFPE